MAGTKKTDNHYTGDKIALRIRYTPFKPDGVTVLDCFGGKGVIWRAVQKKTGHIIHRTAIDQRDDIDQFHLHGNNQKILAGMNLNQFDVIDLDAYGIPFGQLQQVFEKSKKPTIVFVTMIQTMHGRMPSEFLIDVGFSNEQIKKAPTLLCKRGWKLFLIWLAQKGVTRIVHRSKSRKHYLAFGINGAELRAADCHNQPAKTAANPS
jgi:hypothetical protein